MGYSKEAKVGLVFIVGIALLLVMAGFLGAFKSNDKGYNITALAKDVTGLYVGAVIRNQGVDIGRVTAIQLEGNVVRIGLFIKEQYKIPVGSIIGVATSGVLGEKYINVNPPAQLTGEYILPGAEMTAAPSQTAMMMESAAEILTGIQQMVKGINSSLLGPEQQASYRMIVKSAGQTAENVRMLTANTNKMLVTNQTNVELMLINLRQMSETLKSFSQKADNFVSVLNKDDKAAIDMRETIENVKNTTQHLDKIMAALEPTLTDPKTADDIKQTAKNARVLSDTSVDLLKDKQFTLHGGGDMAYGPASNDIQTSVWATMDINSKSFGMIGYDNIGGPTGTGGLNLQYGFRESDGRAYRVGLVDGQPGVGMDMQFNENLWKLGLDLYDPNNLSIKARVEVALTDNLYAMLENYRINQSPKNVYVGVGARF